MFFRCQKNYNFITIKTIPYRPYQYVAGLTSKKSKSNQKTIDFFFEKVNVMPIMQRKSFEFFYM
jgi:hypothetical protein